MATRRNKQEQSRQPERQTFQYDYEIGRVVEYEGTVFADLCLNNVWIYGITVRKANTGKEFLSYPSHKGKDGKYYSYARASMDDQLTDEIIQAIYDKLDGVEE